MANGLRRGLSGTRHQPPAHATAARLDQRLRGAVAGTILTELWRVAFRRTYYRSIAQLEHDVQAYLRFYNWDRSHQGYRLKGRTPATVFLAKKAS
jgi:hypothetical protein